jgi:hypothetical protein
MRQTKQRAHRDGRTSENVLQVLAKSKIDAFPPRQVYYRCRNDEFKQADLIRHFV